MTFGEQTNMADDNIKTLSVVFPRIYVALPNVGEADVKLSDADSPVERRLVADLIVWYAFDVGSHYEMVANRDLARLGVTSGELHEHALANLRALQLEVRATRGPRVMMLTAGGNHEAPLLLLPEIWSSVEQMVTGRMVAAVPARDILLVTGDSDAENLADLRRCTSKSIEQAEKPLSRNLSNGTEHDGKRIPALLRERSNAQPVGMRRRSRAAKNAADYA